MVGPEANFHGDVSEPEGLRRRGASEPSQTGRRRTSAERRGHDKEWRLAGEIGVKSPHNYCKYNT